jgi:hypothetical protein
LEGGANLKIVLADACANESRLTPPVKKKRTRTH